MDDSARGREVGGDAADSDAADRSDAADGWSREWTGDVVWTSEKWNLRTPGRPRGDTGHDRTSLSKDAEQSELGLASERPDHAGSTIFTSTGELVLGGILVLSTLLVAALVVGLLIPRPTPDDSRVYALAAPEHADALWSVDVEGTVDYIVAGGGAVVVGSERAGKLWAFDESSGDELWNTIIEGWPARVQLHVLDGIVIVIDEITTGGVDVRALDPRTGEKLWSGPHRQARLWRHRSMAVPIHLNSR